jgi:hypothetical protein
LPSSSDQESTGPTSISQENENNRSTVSEKIGSFEMKDSPQKEEDKCN